jgi:hypothetical protein
MNSGVDLKGQLQALDQSQDLLHLKRYLERRALHKQERFNVFDALRVTWLELPHSNFLAALLDPLGNHKMGDAFLRAFLHEVYGEAYNPTWVLDDMKVSREPEHIDILLLDETNNLVVIIENKITSPETGAQLKDYWDKIENRYKVWNRIGVYLTPKRTTPSHEEYKALDYNAVERLLGEALEESRGRIDDYAREAIEQYRHVLRRHIVNDFEIAQLARDIHHKHRAALAVIEEEYNHWLKQTVHTLHKDFTRLVSESSDIFFLDSSSNLNYIRFGMHDLIPVGQLSAHRLGSRQDWWTDSGHNLLFVIENSPGSLQLGLHLLADKPEIADTRKRIEEMTNRNPTFWQVRMVSRWLQIYRRPFLKADDYRDWDEKRLLERLDEEWRKFLAGDFKQINDELKAKFFSSDE